VPLCCRRLSACCQRLGRLHQYIVVHECLVYPEYMMHGLSHVHCEPRWLWLGLTLSLMCHAGLPETNTGTQRRHAPCWQDGPRWMWLHQ
jgi:hypothetical protein